MPGKILWTNPGNIRLYGLDPHKELEILVRVLSINLLGGEYTENTILDQISILIERMSPEARVLIGNLKEKFHKRVFDTLQNNIPLQERKLDKKRISRLLELLGEGLSMDELLEILGYGSRRLIQGTANRNRLSSHHRTDFQSSVNTLLESRSQPKPSPAPLSP